MTCKDCGGIGQVMEIENEKPIMEDCQTCRGNG